MGELAIGLPEVVAGVLAVALTAYVLFGGADFGGGVWDLLARGPRAAEQRALVSDSIAPIWEANHVWLIVVIVMLFTAFPAAFAALTTVLHVPLALMLVGIVLRGAAFVFRSYGHWSGAGQRRWGVVFAVASTITPVFLGICVGAVATGAVGEAMARLRAAGAPGSAGAAEAARASFAEVFVWPWLAPFPVATGVLALVLFAFLAAVYLTAAATTDALREDFRRRAIGAGLLAFAVAAVALLVSHAEAPLVRRGLLASGWAIPLQLAIAVAALGAFAALWTRRWRLARVAAAAQVTLVLWGWILAQYPYIVPPRLTIADAAAPRITLVLLLWALAGGAVILLPSLWYLYRTFDRARRNSKSPSDQ
jgi:cytochrome d ubiquinol oxidase subunit II